MTATADQIRALDRYRLNAEVLRRAFHRHGHETAPPGDDADLADPEYFAWMSLWYSAVCVVAEGCLELDLELNLRQELVVEWRVPLKRFRNKTFHRQDDFPAPAMVEYMKRDDSVAWVYALSAECSRAIQKEAERLGLVRDGLGLLRS